MQLFILLTRLSPDALKSPASMEDLDEEKFRYSPEWLRRAEQYLQLAELKTPSTP